MLCYLKLGGSLITFKNRPYLINDQILLQLADEISSLLTKNRNLHLLIGHGSGSFGHAAAKEFKPELAGTRYEQGIRYQKVWKAARDLNNVVINLLASKGIPVMSFPPSGALILENGKLQKWTTMPIQSALDAGLIPVIYGDVVFDIALGNRIVSTETLFGYLSDFLQPDMILISGNEIGVWEDFPMNTKIIPQVTPKIFSKLHKKIKGSSSPDVTGGMLAKVRQLLEIIKKHPTITAQIFSGRNYGNIIKAMKGENVGTTISSQ